MNLFLWCINLNILGRAHKRKSLDTFTQFFQQILVNGNLMLQCLTKKSSELRVNRPREPLFVNSQGCSDWKRNNSWINTLSVSLILGKNYKASACICWNWKHIVLALEEYENIHHPPFSPNYILQARLVNWSLLSI